MHGENYGHQYSTLTYNAAKVDSDLNLLWDAGRRILRAPYCEWPRTGTGLNWPNNTGITTTIDWCSDIAERALKRGFTVIWGVVHTRPVVTASNLENSCAWILSTLLPWAKRMRALYGDRFILSYGNEEELHLDTVVSAGSSINEAQFRTRIKQCVSDSRAAGYDGETDYITDATRRALWIAEGRGDFDRIGFNLYYEWAPTGAFRGSAQTIATSFGTDHTYISEWSTDQGYESSQVFGNEFAESRWAENLKERQSILDSLGLRSINFCMQGGSFGVSATKWPLRNLDGTFREAWYGLNGLRQYGTRTVSERTYSPRVYSERS